MEEQGVSLPEDILAHVFQLMPGADLALTPGLFNVCKLWRRALLKSLLVPLKLHHLLEADNFERQNFGLLSSFGTWNSPLLMVFLKWPCFMYRGKFVSSMIHGLRAASASEVLHRWSTAEKDWNILFDEALQNDQADEASILSVLNRYLSSFDPLQTHKDPRNEEFLIEENLTNLKQWRFDYNPEETRFPLPTAVKLVRLWTSHFPGLPRMFYVSMDPLGRPMFRWSAWVHQYWNRKRLPHPYELRISFKSVDFIRVTVEGLISCNTEPRWEDSELFTGFPMYLDLRSPSALERLFEVLGMFVAMADHLLDRADQLFARIVGIGMKDATVSDEIDSKLRLVCEDRLNMLGLQLNQHNDDFIRKTLEIDGADARIGSDERKFPKTNLVASIRLVKRCVNAIAIKHSMIDFVYGIPRYYRMRTKWYAESEYLAERFNKRKDEIKRIHAKPRSISRGYPRLWTSHFLRHVFNTIPIIVSHVFEQLTTPQSFNTSRLIDGFIIPDLPEVHRVQRLRFVHDTLDIINEIPHQGCPEPLRRLLDEDFQIWEEPHHFERYRMYRPEAIEYPRVSFSRDLIDSLFLGRCTRILGERVQPRYFCVTTKTILCHVCAFRRKAAGDAIRVEYTNTWRGVFIHHMLFTCGAPFVQSDLERVDFKTDGEDPEPPDWVPDARK